MRPKPARPTPVPKVVLELQILEDRVPASEQIGSVVRTVMLSAIAANLGRAPAAAVSSPARPWFAGESPAGVTPSREITLVRVEGAAPAPPARREAVWTESLASDFPDLFDLGDLPLPSLHRPMGFSGGQSVAEPSRADLGGGSAAIPPGSNASVGLGASPSAGPAVPNANSIFLAALPGSALHTAAAAGPGSPIGVVSLGGAGGSAKTPPPDSNPPPIWVLDANNAIVVTPGVTKHDFSGWGVELRAQVFGGTVSSYSWDLTSAADATNVYGQNKFALEFTWANFNQGPNGPHTDTIVLTTVDSVHGQQTQTLTFSVIGQDSPAWVAASARPTTASTWFPALPAVPVVPPDALTPDQETVDSQYYSLGKTTGELLVAHALPTYNTGVRPLTLEYSSLAADDQPVFIDHYTLITNQAVPNWVSAQLTLLNGSTPVFTGQTYYYNTSVLNPGAIMQIALQANGISGLNSGRYTYQIAITANYAPQQMETDSGTVTLLNSSADFGNIFGSNAGWSILGLNRLLPQGTHGANGAILDLGMRQSLWFAPNGSGGFNRAPGDFSTLTYNSVSDTYTRTMPNGTQYTFDTNGLETVMADRNGNTYTLNYDSNGRLQWIKDFNSKVLTLAYNAANKVQSITDPAGRVTSLAYDAGGRVNSITDPTPAMGVAAPVTAFTNDTGVNHILTLTDPNTHVTTFSYNAEGRIGSASRPDMTSWQMAAQQMAGLISVGYGSTPATAVTATLAVQAQAQFTDGRTNTWNTRLDWLGFGLMTQDTDPANDQAVTHRDTNGLPWLVADPIGRRQTRTFYDGNGNPTTVALADESYELYAGYNSFNEPGSYRDATGNVTSFTYDSNGNLTVITQPLVKYDAAGHTANPITTLTYFSGGWVQSIKDALGNVTSFSYDPSIKNRLVTITEPPDYLLNSYTLNYGYDSYGNVNKVTDERGIVSSYGYDALNRLVNVTLANDAPQPVSLYTLSYDAASNLTQLVDPLMHTWNWGYDALNRRVSATDPLTHTWSLSYDGAGNVLTEQDPLTHVTTLGYDTANRLTSVTDPLSHSTTYAVDGAGQVVGVTDALGHTTSYTYSARGWRTAVTTPLGDQTTFAYNAAGDETSMTEYDHTGQAPAAITTMTYDALHRLSTYTDPLSVLTTYTYDLVSNVIETDGPPPSGGPPAAAMPGGCGCGVKCMGYDGKHQMFWETDSMNHTTSFGFDGHGNHTSIEDANQNTVTMVPDSQNRTKAIQQPTITYGGQVTPTTSYSYDLAGNLITVTDPDGNTTSYHFDAANRLQYTTGPNNELTSYTWDAANRLQYVTDPLNQTRSFSYDAADRLTTEQWLNAAQQVQYTATYGYDNANRITSASDPNSAYTYGYDASNRLTSDSKAATASMPAVVLTYGYNGLNDRTSVQDNISIGGGTGQVTYSYDGDHHLKAETWLSGGTQIGNVTLHYDTRNRMDQINRIASSQGAVAVDTSIGYNANDFITTITHNAGATTLASFSYTYDPANRLQSAVEWGVTKTYSYDGFGQLTTVTLSTGGGESYAYDKNGNRTSANGVNYGAVGTGNRLTYDGVYTYNYDSDGEVTSKVGPNDTTTFTYDYRHRLIEAKRTYVGGNVYDDNFTYDVWDRQIGKSETVNLVTATRWTAFDGANPYADYNGLSWSTRYLYGREIDQLFARYDATNGVEWYLTDRLGSVVDIVSATGASLDTITYDSFGNATDSNSAYTNGDRFKYTGREWDAAIGQYDYRARYYDPSVGRFDTEDPLSFSAGDVNLYRYVGNSPENAEDPTGLAADDGVATKKGEAFGPSGKVILRVYRMGRGDDGDIYGVLEVNGKKSFFGRCVHAPGHNVPIVYRDAKGEITKIVWYNLGFKSIPDRDAFMARLEQIRKNPRLTYDQKNAMAEDLIQSESKKGTFVSTNNCPPVIRFNWPVEKGWFADDYVTWPRYNGGKEYPRLPDSYLNPKP